MILPEVKGKWEDWAQRLTSVLNDVFKNVKTSDSLGQNVGEFFFFAGSKLPPDSIECRGQELKISDFPELFKTVGDAFSLGTESDGNFRLPQGDYYTMSGMRLVVRASGRRGTREVTGPAGSNVFSASAGTVVLTAQTGNSNYFCAANQSLLAWPNTGFLLLEFSADNIGAVTVETAELARRSVLGPTGLELEAGQVTARTYAAQFKPDHIRLLGGF